MTLIAIIVGKKMNPFSEKPFNNTILAEGIPSAEAVASVIAFTSSMFEAMASCHHLSNWIIGLDSTESSDNVFCE